jgi:hypothetical protein
MAPGVEQLGYVRHWFDSTIPPMVVALFPAALRITAPRLRPRADADVERPFKAAMPAFVPSSVVYNLAGDLMGRQGIL